MASEAERSSRTGVAASSSRRRVFSPVYGRRLFTPDTALRLAQVLRMPADFWLGLQTDWDLWHAERSKGAKAIKNLEPFSA